jgi:Pyruvate/2-oxoacid:ferredoxin oxidoreductase delta subunit
MDAIVGLEGNGPAAIGTPKPTGLLLAARNPFALDCAVSRIIGIDPLSVQTVPAGICRGLIPEDCSFKSVGDFPSLPSIPYRMPAMGDEEDRAHNTLYRIVCVRPVVVRAHCDACGLCAAKCPFGAISIGGSPSRAEIDYARCMNCYLCHYACPKRAIKLRGGWYVPAVYAIRRLARI